MDDTRFLVFMCGGTEPETAWARQAATEVLEDLGVEWLPGPDAVGATRENVQRVGECDLLLWIVGEPVSPHERAALAEATRLRKVIRALGLPRRPGAANTEDPVAELAPSAQVLSVTPADVRAKVAELVQQVADGARGGASPSDDEGPDSKRSSWWSTFRAQSFGVKVGIVSVLVTVLSIVLTLVQILQAEPLKMGIHAPVCRRLHCSFRNFVETGDRNDAVVTRWDFGDGAISYEVSPTHNYEREGRQVVTLFTTGRDGKTKSTSRDFITYDGRINRGVSLVIEKRSGRLRLWGTLSSNVSGCSRNVPVQLAVRSNRRWNALGRTNSRIGGYWEHFVRPRWGVYRAKVEQMKTSGEVCEPATKLLAWYPPSPTPSPTTAPSSQPGTPTEAPAPSAYEPPASSASTPEPEPGQPTDRPPCTGPGC